MSLRRLMALWRNGRSGDGLSALAVEAMATTAAAQEMPNALLVTAPGLGHTVGHIGCLPVVVTAFFDKGKASASAAAAACTTNMSPPAFLLG